MKDKDLEGSIPYYLRDDFVSDLALRFCTSAIKFDEEMGFKFSTYAYGGFYLCCRDIRTKYKLLYQKNNFLSQDDVWDFLNSTSVDVEDFEEEVLFDIINKAKLNEREMMILRGHYLEGRSMAKVGREIGLSRERISQILKGVLRKIRRVASIEKLSLVDFYRRL